MTTEPTSTGLDIKDIQNVVAIIDYAADQGAFKGWQIINEVAGVRTRLAAFLEVVAEAQKAQADAAPAPTGPETEPALAPGA